MGLTSEIFSLGFIFDEIRWAELGLLGRGQLRMLTVIRPELIYLVVGSSICEEAVLRGYTGCL